MVLVAGAASSANAAIVSFMDQNIGIPTTFAGVSVNLETGAFEDNPAILVGLSGGDMNFVFGGEWITNDADGGGVSPTWQPVRIGTGAQANNALIRNLGIGAIVGPSSAFASGYGGSTGHIAAPPSPAAPNETFEAGEKGFIGFSLEVDSGPASTVYGWVEVTLQGNDSPGVIHSWAFENNGSPLAVGSLIPEPSQSMLTALGVLGAALRRRRGVS
ncbi:PEP-CTERM sorting domain-containing protein [Akkermansiaceae bacterium]|nr:PEP-CTERM sorting domain-containing protein [Akkermansiaceae bacterium]